MAAVVGGEASPVALADYAATTWATLAIERSLATGRAVKIAEIAEDTRGDRD